MPKFNEPACLISQFINSLQLSKSETEFIQYYKLHIVLLMHNLSKYLLRTAIFPDKHLMIMSLTRIQNYLYIVMHLFDLEIKSYINVMKIENIMI